MAIGGSDCSGGGFTALKDPPELPNQTDLLAFAVFEVDEVDEAGEGLFEAPKGPTWDRVEP